jgi:hypothetical protein
MADDDQDEGRESRSFDIEKALSSLIARNNNSERQALRTLSEDNYQYRKTIRELKKKISGLEKRPELKEGEQVVSKEDHKVLTDFKALNVKVEDVKTGLQERDTLKGKESERKKADTIAKGLKHFGYNPEVMTDLISTRSLLHENREIEIDDEEEEGKKKTVVALHLRATDKDEWKPADKFAEKHLKGYLPALRPGDDEDGEESEDDEAAGRSRRDQDEQPRRQPFPRQASGTRSKAPRNSADVANQHIVGRYVPPSKLRETQR